MNRRMTNGTYGGVRGWGREAPAYSIKLQRKDVAFMKTTRMNYRLSVEEV